MPLQHASLPPLPELRIQYKDFSHWQNQVIRSEEMKAQENYWKEKLHGDLPVLDLPTDRPRPAVQTHNAETLKMDIGRDLSSRLKNLAKELSVTPFMLTLSLFKALLHKMTGQEDIIVGSPIANRTNRDIEPLIGFFVNMLPIRSSLSGNPVFREFLHEVKQTTLSAYANQDFPFDRVVEVVNPLRDMSRSPVFDVVFEYRDLYLESFMNFSIDMDKVSVRDITGEDPIAKYDIFATFSQGKDTLLLQFEYNRDLFDKASMQRMMGYFVNLIREVLHDPDRRLSDITILGRAEMDQILLQFNDTRLDVPTDVCMHTLFEKAAQRHHDRPAVIFKGEKTTYEALDKTANKLAHLLIEKGAGKGEIIGILMERSFGMVASQLASWKAGCAFLPIDPSYPSERIGYMIADSRSKVLITRKDHLQNLYGNIDNVICLDEASGDVSHLPESSPDVFIEADSLAYVVYTSGSTGRPKGAQVMHRNLVNLCFWHNHVFNIGETGRAALCLGVSFDASIYEIWPHLIAGSCVVPLEKILNEMSPQDLVAWLKMHRITCCNIPTKLSEVVLGMDLSDLCLDIFHMGGDRLRFVPRRHAFHVINNYGPAETTVVATAVEVTGWDNARGNPPIGKPVSNVNIYILDNYLKPVPIGVMGELYIGGAAVGKGYLNDPEKTKNAFILNPFSNNGDLLYRTGDFVRWLPDGNVDYIGRKDFQVEIRGYRVEIGEIEAVLSGFDGIKECVVIDKTDEKGSTRLAGFHVSDESFDEAACYAHLKKQLPAHMIPSRLIRLDKFPTTPNDKLDRRALSSMVDVHLDSTVMYVAPRDDVETALSDAWQDVLNVKRVGVHDNFFDLGGDSIISLLIVMKLNQRGYSMHPKDILQYQTIAELSAVVEKARANDAEQGPVTGTSSLMPIQRWFFDHGFSNEHQFNQALLFKSGIGIDENALKKSLKYLMAHHDALRSSFTKTGQTFHPSTEEVCLIVKNVENEEDLNKEILFLQSSFDIYKGPVFGVGLYRMGESDYLLLAGHHLVVDGVSWRILTEDLLTGYSAALSESEILLPPKTTSYKTWADQLDAYARESELKDEIAFWGKMLSEDITSLFIDFDKGPNTYGSSDIIRKELDEKSTNQLLKEIHTAYNTQVNDILLTALMLAQAAWTRHDDVLFTLEGHGREDIMGNVNISRTVGWFTTLYPVVLHAGRDEDPAFHIKYVKEKLRSIPHKGFNFGVLKYRGDITPLVRPEIGFNYLGQITQKDMGDLFSLVRTDTPGTMAEQNIRGNRIDINCMVMEGRLRMDFQFSRNQYNWKSIDDFAGMFTEKLSLLIRHCLDPDNFGITPSDFELAGIDQEMLDKILEFE